LAKHLLGHVSKELGEKFLVLESELINLRKQIKQSINQSTISLNAILGFGCWEATKRDLRTLPFWDFMLVLGPCLLQKDLQHPIFVSMQVAFSFLELDGLLPLQSGLSKSWKGSGTSNTVTEHARKSVAWLINCISGTVNQILGSAWEHPSRQDPSIQHRFLHGLICLSVGDQTIRDFLWDLFTALQALKLARINQALDWDAGWKAW
jgi:hypothetical protein